MGLGVPGLSVLSDLDIPTFSEKELDLFLAALMGTLRELLRESKEAIVDPGHQQVLNNLDITENLDDGAFTEMKFKWVYIIQRCV